MRHKEYNFIMKTLKLTTKAIIEALSEDWQPITALIFKMQIKDMTDARFLQIKLKQLERKGFIKVESRMGKKHYKFIAPDNIVEGHDVEENFDIDRYRQIKDLLKVSNDSEEVKFGIMGRYSYFWSANELFLPVDTSYIKSEIYKKLIEDIRPFIGFAINFNKDMISIRESAIFHMGYGELPYLWDTALEKGLGSIPYADVLGPDTERFYYILEDIINPDYQINPNYYGTIEKNKNRFFSYGDEELILPLDLSYMKNDSIHQSIKEMLQKINIIAGFLFNRDESKNLLTLLDDEIFKDYHVDWDLKNRKFVDQIMDITNIQVENSEKFSKLTSGFLIFISYSTKDSNIFNISHLSKEVAKFPEIEKVLYWEEDMNDDIIDYMNRYIKKCDLFILICSQNALESKPVNMEWQAALKIGKKIIPVFKNENDIPVLLSTKLGIKYDENNLEKTIKDLHYLILKKLKKKD